MRPDLPDDETVPPPRRRGWAVRIVVGILLVGLGVAGGIMWSERRAARTPASPESATRTDTRGQASVSPAGPSTPTPSTEPTEVTLSPDAIARAGITVAPVTTEAVGGVLAVPATIGSNAYRDTKVHALVGGVLRQVHAELGTAVRRGQPLAVVFSSELADAQMKYLAGRAMLEADHQKRERTQKLVAIGAVSKQDFEEVVAVHEAHSTEVAAARQRLLLLGLSESQVDRLRDASQVVSELTITAPADGVVIARAVNPGQVVTASQELFTVTDLGTLWAIGDLYEKDFGAVRVGTQATLTLPAVGTSALRGRVAYIDPRVDPATRTAKVRVEIPNKDAALRLGMFVTLTFDVAGGAKRAVIPRAAVQTIGDRSVVYVDEGDGRFVERPVRLGGGDAMKVEVLDGLKTGERVVIAGSFFLRAEAARTRGGS
jgi:membrane fusion protein, heavy metal efflux system